MKVVHTSGIRIATLSGHVARLEPGVPADLPDFLAIMALGQGARQVLEGGEVAVDPAILTMNTPPPETRHQKLVRVMQDIIVTGDPANFRQDKQPKSAVLNRLFGEAVLEEERNAAWDEATRKL
jgi:hypothetical protein